MSMPLTTPVGAGAPPHRPGSDAPHQSPPLSPWVALPALGLLAALLATSTRYGYHRDELYFVVAGQHPAWGYPDQPPLVPLLCAAAQYLAPGSLTVLRLASALAAAGTVLLAALVAREFGATARAQIVAAGCAATSGIVLATGHFVTTTTFDVLSTSALCWLVVRALARRTGPPLLAAGVVVGLGMQVKPQVGVVAVALVLALAAFGPRWPLRDRWLWAGAVAAAVLAAPYLVWQATHDWPQLTVAGNIAGSAEGGRVGFLPFQLVLVAPPLVPVWVAGLVRLCRAPLRAFRALPVAYLLLAVAYLAGNGKGYYLAGLYPALLGAGALGVDGWLARGRQRLRRGLVAAAVGVSAVVNCLVGLPLLPATALNGSPSVALNPDLAETVGWPDLVDQVGEEWRRLPADRRAHAVVLTSNYGEAGALTVLADPAPPVFSAHNGWYQWGPPPADTSTVLTVGYSPAALDRFFTDCQVRGHVGNAQDVDNDENGSTIAVCGSPRQPWPALWPRLRHYD